MICYPATTAPIDDPSSLLALSVTGWMKDWTGSFAWGCDTAAGIALAGVPVAMAVRPAFRLGAAGPAV